MKRIGGLSLRRSDDERPTCWELSCQLCCLHGSPKIVSGAKTGCGSKVDTRRRGNGDTVTMVLLLFRVPPIAFLDFSGSCEC